MHASIILKNKVINDDMKKSVLLIVIVLIVGIGSIVFSQYNKFPRLDEQVTNAWADLESSYQRRSDLIPNLVNIVKGVAEQELEVITEATNARAKLGQINIDAESLGNAELMQQFQANQSGIGSALSRLIAVSEAYPELKSNENFLTLQSQYEGTENRINVARNDYNAAVREFNIALRSIPGKWVADIFFPSMTRKTPFEADTGAEVAPTIEF